jgi:hypothetical protein
MNLSFLDCKAEAIVMNSGSLTHKLTCSMLYESGDDSRLPQVGFRPNRWIDGAGDQFIIGRIDAVDRAEQLPQLNFYVEMTFLGIDELGLKVEPGLKVRLFRVGWNAIWMIGEVVSFD